MLGKKCSLCGGPLVNNRCTLCGLDNSICDREASRGSDAVSKQGRSPSMEPVSRDVSSTRKQKADPSVPPKSRVRQSSTVSTVRQSSAGTTYSPASRGQNQKQKSRLIWIIIIVVILFAALPALTDLGSTMFEDIFGSYSSDSYSLEDSYSDDWSIDDYTYDPYSYVTREIPAEGDPYEVLLGNGIYKVGVHIPEGVYRAELAEGTGSIQIRDEENSIFHSVYFGTDEEYNEVTEDDDIRLYNGAELEIDSNVILRFTTDNAQPLTEEPSANPLTESVTVEEGTYTAGDGEIPEGIFDISAIDISEGGNGYASITLVYPDGTSSYLWADSQDFTVTTEDFTNASVKNVVIPDGTEVSVEYGDTVFTPSEGYYDVDFAQYNGY